MSQYIQIDTNAEYKEFNNSPSRLHVPLAIDVTKLPTSEIETIINVIAEQLGAKFWRDRSLLWDVLNDYLEASKKPFSHSRAYVMMYYKDNGELRISCTQCIRDEGLTVYAPEQLLELVANVVRKDGCLVVAT